MSGMEIFAVLKGVALVIGATSGLLGAVNLFRAKPEEPPKSTAAKIVDRLAMFPPGLVRGWMNGKAPEDLGADGNGRKQ